MIACTAFTQDSFYREAHLRLQESCIFHRIELRSVECYFKADNIPGLRQEAYRALIFSMIHTLQAIDSESEDFILIGCDDTFTRKPDLSSKAFDVAFWINPELETRNTHLFLAAQFVVRRTEAAMNFLTLTLAVMDRFKINDHRAFHAARMMMFGEYREADITEEMQGVICRVPSKVQGGRDAT